MSGTVTGSARNAEACVYGAVGANNTVGAAHAGVSDLTYAETLSSDSFPTFDFTSVWGIDPERGPYVLALAVTKSGYAAWSAAVETELTVDSEGRVAFSAFASAPQAFFKLQAETR